MKKTSKKSKSVKPRSPKKEEKKSEAIKIAISHEEIDTILLALRLAVETTRTVVEKIDDDEKLKKDCMEKGLRMSILGIKLLSYAKS